MGRVTSHLSMSLDGFIAGPSQALDFPVGVGGIELLQWQDSPDEADQAAAAELFAPMGAFVMGRNMFGPIRGPWYDDWRGWWGENPPYHSPVFVITHFAHDPIEMAGDTTFHFVTEGFDAALSQATAAAAGGDVRICGGASTARQAFAAGVVDDFYLDIIPVALGSGEKIFDGPLSGRLKQLDATHSSTYTHIHYGVR